MRFCIHTFGCQMNVADSDWLGQSLTAMGWEASPEEQADVFIINTCSVREKPELKVYSLIGRLAEFIALNPRAFVAVGGCVAQQVGTKFWQRFASVRLVFGSDGLAEVPEALVRLAREPGLRLSLLSFREEFVERARPGTTAAVPPQAFVTIMQGCDNFCAYCIVPYVRGRQKSRAIEAVLAECRELIIRGARELTLLGQNVNAYGQDLNGAGVGFASLLRRVAALPGLDRLRFITSHPKDIDPEVIAAFGQLPNLCPQLHLPLQSGSDAILASMGRKYDRARYLEVVAGLRSARPDLALSTDFIVGFPGETEADFEQTLAMMHEVGFSASFSFKYNDRPGVRAANMEPKVPEAVKTERLSRLQALQDELAAADRAARVGNEAEVLFEGMSRKPGASGASYSGRDPWGRTVNVAGGEGNDLTGLLARVRIDKVKKHSLTGTLLGVPW